MHCVLSPVNKKLFNLRFIALFGITPAVILLRGWAGNQFLTLGFSVLIAVPLAVPCEGGVQ